MFFGLVLIIIGAVFLLQNLGILTGDSWNVVWPAIIILLGIIVLTKPAQRKSRSDRSSDKKDE